jgi:hypothetical protein
MRTFLLGPAAAAAAVAFAVAAAALVGCAASPDGVSAEQPAIDLRHAPPDPGAPASSSGVHRGFVMRSMDLGSGTADGWENLGLDIDGRVSTAGSTDVCRLAPGAPASVHQDGIGGIDNSFGANLVPMLVTLFGDQVIARMNASFAPGGRTNLLDVQGLPSSGEATVVASLDGATFPRAWLAQSTLASAPSTDEVALVLGLVGAGAPGEPAAELVVPVTHVQIVAAVGSDGWSIERGVLSGVLPTEDAVAAVDRFALALDPEVSADVLRTAESTVRQAADILVDGSQDPSRACDGISMGLAFTADARPVPLRPDVSPVRPPLPEVAPSARGR